MPYTVATREPETAYGYLLQLQLLSTCACFLASSSLDAVVHGWTQHPGQLLFMFVFDAPLLVSSQMIHSSTFETSQIPLISQT